MKTYKTDILILGSGGAGLFAALHAHQANPALSITVAVKGLLGKCGCTRMVQGGYNVALAKEDSIERHFMDTIEGGKWLPNQEIAWTLVTKAIERVRELENEIGCFFDRNADGTLHGKAFAGQTFDRTVHKGDLTGIEIINRLMEQVWARPIRRLEEHRAVALIPARGGGSLAGVLTRAERQEHHLPGVHLLEDLGERRHRGIDREHASVHQRTFPNLERFEVGGCRRGRPCHHRQGKVLLGGALARLAGLEEVGAGLGHVVGRNDQVGPRIGQALVG